MNKQTRILIGDIGVRFEHPDVLILNISVPEMHFLHFAEAVQHITEMPIFALCRNEEPYMERLLSQQAEAALCTQQRAAFFAPQPLQMSLPQ